MTTVKVVDALVLLTSHMRALISVILVICGPAIIPGLTVKVQFSTPLAPGIFLLGGMY